ncbi:hypothetical protein LCGC14_1524290, partial [marine sediment metagenome]
MVRSIIRKAQIRGTDVKTWFTKSPTSIDSFSISQAVNTVDRAVDNIGLLNPAMSSYLPNQPTAMALLPEITAAVQDDLVGPSLLEALYGEDFSLSDIETDSDVFHLEVYDHIGPRLAPEANLAVLRSVAGLEGRQADSYLAEVVAYLDNHDMSVPNAMAQFTVWQYERAYNKQQEFLQEQTIIGRAGEIVSQPIRGTSSVFAATWGNAVAPQDSWYRRHLSPGQNIAISWGQDPGTAGYERLSGTADGIWNIVGDPVAYAANLAMGAKIVKGTALLTNMSRVRLALKAIVPFVGKRSFEQMGVRGSTRFISNRLGMVLGARTSDQLTTSPKAVRLWRVLAKADSPGIIIDRIPEWANATDLVAAVARESDPDVIQVLVRQGLEGAFDSADDLHQVARLDLETAANRFDDALQRAIRTSEPVTVRPSGDTFIDEFGDVQPVVVNEGLRQEALGMANVVRRTEHVLEESATTSSGLELTLRYYDTADTKAVIAFNEADDIVGARIGTSVGIDVASERQGVYTALLEGQKKNQGLTIADFGDEATFLEPGAATVINRVFGGDDVGLGAVDGLGGYTARRGVWLADELTPTVLDGTGARKVILHQDAKVLDYTSDKVDETWDAVIAYVDKNFGENVDVTLDHVNSYARAMGFDAIVDEAGKLDILNQKRVLIGADTDVTLTDELIGSFMEWSDKQGAANRLNSGNRTSTWIIDEMPVGSFPDDIDQFNTVRPTFFGGGSTSRSWWRRAVKARAFGKYPPNKVSITDVAQGRKQLQTYLRYIGLHEDDVRRLVEGFTDVSFINRHRYVRNAIKEAAETVDNPIIRHNLIEYVDRGANASYGRLNGKEVLTTASSVDLSEQAARPFIPSMLSNGVDLPDPQGFSQALARYKTSRRMGPRFRRGYISKTKDRRDALIASITRKLKKQYGDDFGFTKPEIEAMAYSVVGSGDRSTDGLGAVAHAATAVNRVWRWGVQAFSIS